jgi:2'-5' RNA ligase
MRLFFAIPFSDETKSTIQAGIDQLAISNPPWRWVAMNNFHITMKFLGETDERLVESLSGCATTVCQDFRPFRIQLGALGGFPKLVRPRVLFYRVMDGAEPLAALAGRLDTELFERLSIEREGRPFRAHATIARVKRPPERAIVDCLERAAGLENTVQDVHNLALMRSELHRDGARYHILKEFALSKSKC